jgi:hypothetical protein
MELPKLSDGSLAPEFRAIALRETSDWNEKAEGYHKALEIAGGEFYTIYLYDRRRITHICSLTGSYGMHFVSYTGNLLRQEDRTDEEREWLDEWMSQADCPNWEYIDEGAVDRLEFPSTLHKLVEDFALRDPEELEGVTWEDCLEESLEYVHGNSMF